MLNLLFHLQRQMIHVIVQQLLQQRYPPHHHLKAVDVQ
ncbi:unnamed protein product, partial [Trichobilharzia regenti]